MSRKLWRVNKTDKVKASELAESLRLFPVAALIAVARGVDTPEKARAFFDDDLDPVDPFAFTDMKKAVNEINRAVDEFERIAVSGDYDADGITATALLYSYLDSLGADVILRIPERSEGYGLSKAAIDEFEDLGVKLIITVDCGISSVEEAEYCRQKGIRLVVTDHHVCGDVLPDCQAVVDPHRKDCDLPFSDFAGVGVAYKLVCAVEGGDEDVAREQFSDLAAIGTVGDIMPLVGENRRIVRSGLRMINDEERVGINALRKVSGSAGKRISASDLSYTLVPRINAAGRMGSPSRALNMLLCEDEDHCLDLADEINRANAERHEAEKVIIDDIDELLAKDPSRACDRVIVVDGEGWHKGVIGIVAARLVERFGKPVIVLSRDGEETRGSGRSVEGFSLYDAIRSCADCLDQFGGHPLAAGLGLRSGRIAEFRRRINEYAAGQPDVRPVLNIDCKLSPRAINGDLLDALSTLEPFGAGNPLPLFGLFGVKIDGITPLGEGKHIRLSLSKQDHRFTAMRFGVSPDRFPFRSGDTVDLAVTVEPNEYNGEIRPTVRVRDIRATGMSDEAVLDGMALYDKIIRGDEMSEEERARALPDRDYMLRAYKLIRSGVCCLRDPETVCLRLGNDGSDYAKAAVSIEAMLELGTLLIDEKGRLALPKVTVKADLGSSGILSRLTR